MSEAISRDEWLAALGEADTPNDPDALTKQELCGLLKVSRSAVQERLARLLAEGKATRTTKIVKDGMGRRLRVPAYKLVKADAPRPATRRR